MAKDKRQESLPESEDFWESVDNDQAKEFYATCVFEKIRRASPKDEQSRIEFIAQLKIMVELMDSPREIFRSIQINKLNEQEAKDLQDVL